MADESLKILLTDYMEAKEEEKAAKEHAKRLNDLVKSRLKAMGTDVIEVDGIQAKIIEQDRSKMDEKKLVWRLKELGLNEAIKVVEQPDDNAIEGLIYNGKLSPNELESCMEKKIIQTLRVKRK